MPEHKISQLPEAESTNFILVCEPKLSYAAAQQACKKNEYLAIFNDTTKRDISSFVQRKPPCETNPHYYWVNNGNPRNSDSCSDAAFVVTHNVTNNNISCSQPLPYICKTKQQKIITNAEAAEQIELNPTTTLSALNTLTTFRRMNNNHIPTTMIFSTQQQQITEKESLLSSNMKYAVIAGSAGAAVLILAIIIFIVVRKYTNRSNLKSSDKSVVVSSMVSDNEAPNDNPYAEIQGTISGPSNNSSEPTESKNANNSDRYICLSEKKDSALAKDIAATKSSRKSADTNCCGDKNPNSSGDNNSLESDRLVLNSLQDNPSDAYAVVNKPKKENHKVGKSDGTDKDTTTEGSDEAAVYSTLEVNSSTAKNADSKDDNNADDGLYSCLHRN